MTDSRPEDTDGARRESATGLIRQTAEFLVVLSLSIMIFRTFAAEAYVVPTGSMAPTLLGFHKVVECPNCHFRFPVGMDEEGRSGRPVCPNCGNDDLGRAPFVECNGDRLLVQKFLYDVRRPRRWEVAVFQSPSEPDQAYVKRVVGLPGESIQIVDGDIYVDGEIARKDPDEQRAIRIPVYDHTFTPADSDRFPRWHFRGSRGGPSGWTSAGSRFVHEPHEHAPAGSVDWLEYRHWEADRGRYGPVRDFAPYNGADLRGENPVTDLILEANVAAGAALEALVVRLHWGSVRFEVEIPVAGDGSVDVRRDGRSVPVEDARGGLSVSPAGEPAFQLLEASVVDRRLSVRLDGEFLFKPLDFDAGVPGPAPFASPLALGARGGRVEVADLRIFRDVYYTSSLAHAPRRPFAVDTPYRLGPDEYFVLGDNSAVSNDSRFWDLSPVVPGTMFLGKPFLVHLPGQVVPLQVLGRSVYWVPDPREIRYIR